MAKLLTHSSASYSPTLTQKSQHKLLSQIAGEMRVMSFFPHPSTDEPNSTREVSGNLHKPPIQPNIQTALQRQDKRKEEKSNWLKRNSDTPTPRISNTNIFKRARTNTRVRVNRNSCNN